MTSRPFQPQVFAILSALVEEKTGLHYGHADGAIAWDKLAARAEDAGFESILDYYYFLRYDPAGDDELRALTDALVVRETYFFREYDPLRVVCDEVILAAVAKRERARVWSAACSTEEEPLTLAMMLARRGVLERVDLMASDVSERSLEYARAGRFHGRAMRAIPPAEESGRWLREVGGAAVVDPAIAARVRWFQQNLLDDAAIRRLYPLDLILCRNVLIYFSEATIARVVTSLANALRPGGVLLVGVSESLMRIDVPLECEERSGAFLYRRPAS